MAANSKADSSRTIRFEDDNEDDNGNLTSPPPVFTWTKARKSSSRGRLIHGSDDTCTYISSNEGRGHGGRLTKFYIGIYHKPTSTVKFIPASEKGTVFNMNQSVTSYHDSKGMDFRNLSIAERRRMVFESFGSQKKKKVMKSQQANIVEMRSVVGAGEGMMKSLGKQMDGNMMSESNMKVMEELKNQKDSSGKVRWRMMPFITNWNFCFYSIMSCLSLLLKKYIKFSVSHFLIDVDCGRQSLCSSKKKFPPTI